MSKRNAANEDRPGRAEWRLEVDVSGALPVPPPESMGRPAVSLDGYHIGPDDELTLAVTESEGDPPADWTKLFSTMEAHRLAVLHSSHRDERGRTVHVLHLRPSRAVPLVESLRSLLLLPVTIRGSEVSFELAASEGEAGALEQDLRRAGVRVVSVSRTGLRAPPASSGLTAEDWGFLGLVDAAGLHDADEDIDRATVVARLGLDPVVFDRHLQKVQHGLQGLVRELLPSGSVTGRPGEVDSDAVARWGS